MNTNNEPTKSILFTGGGTAGHIYPNLVIMDRLNSLGYSTKYIGEKDGLEERIISQLYPYYSTRAIKLSRNRILVNLKIPFCLFNYIHQAIKLLRKLKPNLIFSKGGYVALPVIIAGKYLKIPIIAHESDCSLGIVTKISKRLGATILVGNSHLSNSGIYVGIPIRKSLLNNNTKTSRAKLGINNSLPTLLITGGSLGATALNEVIFSSLNELTPLYNVIHLIGKKNTALARTNYYPINYSEDMGSLYCVADVVISRAGATSLAELDALGKRKILIPLPSGASRGDQLENIKFLDDKNAIVIPQDEFNTNSLLSAVIASLSSPPPVPKGNFATEKICRVIMNKL